MKYEFPLIQGIDCVLPHIQGSDDFMVIKKDGYTTVNYNKMGLETFPNINTDGPPEEQALNRLHATIRRECRGLLFCNDTGELLRRSYHKFFNLGERVEVSLDKVDLTQPHVILEKLDGSMITPIMLGDNVRWTTKAGITDVSMAVEVYVEHHEQYRHLARHCLVNGHTPIFEWCSRSNRIVIDHPVDRLVLTAIRNNHDGKYGSLEFMESFTEGVDIPMVQSIENTHANFDEFLCELSAKEGLEGFVIRFDDGHMLKVKTEWYVQIHRAKDNLIHEKRIMELYVSNNYDDLLAFLPKDDAERLTEFMINVDLGVNKVAKSICKDLETLRKQQIDRKRFAIEYAHLYPSIIRMVMFSVFDTKSEDLLATVHMKIQSVIAKSTGSKTSVDNARPLWDNHRWTYSIRG